MSKPKGPEDDSSVEPIPDPSAPASDKSGDSSSSFEKRSLIKKRFWVPAVGIIALAATAMFVLGRQPANFPHASNEPDPMAEERTAVADFSVRSLRGEAFKLSGHYGKVLLITYWNSECSTCVVELPAFAQIFERYKSEGLEVVAINVDPEEIGAKAADELWERGHFGFPAYLDPNRESATALGLETLPMGFVIDRKGRLAFVSSGANDWLAPETARLIEDLLLEE